LGLPIVLIFFGFSFFVEFSLLFVFVLFEEFVVEGLGNCFVDGVFVTCEVASEEVSMAR
jgi:hypothetical protein